MCTLFLFINYSSSYPYLLISNRDEYRKRKSSMIEGWDSTFSNFGNTIFAPKDELKQGTWFGCLNQKQPKWGILTNIRDLKYYNQNLQSRGEIIPSYLKSNLAAELFLENLRNISDKYNYFNLILSDSKTVYYYNSKKNMYTKLHDCSSAEKKVFGLSNADLDSNWPKLVNTKRNLLVFMNQNLKKEVEIHKYWEYFRKEMRTPKVYPLAELPNTGVSPEMEVFLSSLFIPGKDYGTRSTILFGIGKSYSLNFYEQTYNDNALVDQAKNIQVSFY